MEFTSQDYLKKALLDTQERVRDFMHFSQKMEDEKLRDFFQSYADSEAVQARHLHDFIIENSSEI